MLVFELKTTKPTSTAKLLEAFLFDCAIRAAELFPLQCTQPKHDVTRIHAKRMSSRGFFAKLNESNVKRCYICIGDKEY